MKQKAITILLVVLGFSGHAIAQNYSYSFQGAVKDSTELSNKLYSIDWIETVVIQTKPERSVGEILFQVTELDKIEEKMGIDYNPSPLSDVKALLLREGLQPLELLKLKK